MNTKALRQKILDLAIHGKLVPQDPNDEPASVLLERIRDEKERLIKEGKIKRPKKAKATSDKPHYENVPFEIPDGWCWTTIEDVCSKIGSGSTPKGSNYSKEGIPFFRSQNVQNDGIVLSDIKYISDEVHQSMIGTEVVANDLLLNITGGSLGRCAVVPRDFDIGNVSQHVCILRTVLVKPEYLHCFILSSFFSKSMKITGSGREGLPKYNLEKMLLPLPPIQEQERIIIEAKRLQNNIDKIDTCNGNLVELISQTKSKVLDLAIHGKLVPQDPTDEPASELLKRINPKAEITCDNGHYQKLPEGWAVCQLDNIVSYEQPTPYIVKSTDYDDTYTTPVLTAGKSFIIGHTNETNGIYEKLPCIIFDDFTTDSKLVDFPFKVKSSAMKILQVKEDINIEYIAMFMSITRLIGDTHKRYWISEYSKIEIPIPPKNEQDRIVKKVRLLLNRLGTITANL